MTKENKKGKVEERTNPRTGQTEYRKKFHWKTANGKDHSSRTKWFPTEEEALEAADAERFARDETGVLTGKTLLQAIKEYDKWLTGEENERMNAGTAHTLLGVGRVLEKTLPDRFARTRAFDLSKETLRDILRYYMNTYRPKKTGKLLADNSIGNYRKYFSHFLRWLEGTEWSAHGSAYMDSVRNAIRETRRDGELQRRREKLKKPMPEGDFITYKEFLRVMGCSEYQPLSIEGATVKPLPLQVSQPDSWMDADEDEIPGGSLDFAYTIENPGILLDESGNMRVSVLYTTALYVLFFTGLRFEELRALRWRHISFEYSTLYVDDAKNYRVEKERKKQYEEDYGTVKTPNSRRMITMHKNLWYILMVYRRLSEYYYTDKLEDSYIFRSRATGDMITPETLRRFFNKLLEKSGVHHITIHQLRHSTAHYLCYELGMSKEHAVMFMGHGDSKMLDSVYARATISEKKSVLTDATRDIIQQTDAVKAYLSMDYEHRREADIKAIPAQRESKKQAEKRANIQKIQKAYADFLEICPDVYLPPIEKAEALSDTAVAEIAESAEKGLDFLKTILKSTTKSDKEKKTLAQSMADGIFTY